MCMVKMAWEREEALLSTVSLTARRMSPRNSCGWWVKWIQIHPHELMAGLGVRMGMGMCGDRHMQ